MFFAKIPLVRLQAMFWGRVFVFVGTSVLLMGLMSCNRTSLEKTFSADPKAEQWNMAAEAKLATDFPADLKYPNAVLKSAVPIAKVAQETPGQETQWSSNDSPDKVLLFYRKRLRESGWTDFKETVGEGGIIVVARKQSLQISVSIPPVTPSTTAKTDFTIVYRQDGVSAPSTNNSPEPNATSTARPASSASSASSNLVPSALQPYVNDVSQLNVLSRAGGAAALTAQPMSRAMFARWLVEANNRIYRDRPARQIRLAGDSKPAFQDVTAKHPDFAYVQGLAEAGYLPSPLTGDSTQARFRPNEPLTREMLLLWKVPVDRQQILPTVSADRVKQLWGFKDASRITPVVLSAIAADHQNSDLSNIRRVFGSTLLFQPQKPVTEIEAAASLWFIGIEGESLSAQDLLRSEQQTKAQQSEPSPEPNASGKSVPSSQPTR
jgi:hypothetical protein